MGPLLDRRDCLRVAAALLLPAAAGAQEQVTVRIGHVAPTSGWATFAGIECENGARLAIEQLNARGVRIGGAAARFELIAADDRDHADTARSVARAMVAAGARAVVGHLTSGATIAAAPIYAEAGLAQITPSATNPAFTHMGLKTAFRLVADDTKVAQLLSRHVVQELKLARMAVIDNGTVYGQGLAELFTRAATSAGGEIVVARRVEPTVRDFGEFVAAAAAGRADVVFFAGFDPQAGRLLRQMNELGLGARFVGGDGACTPDMVSYYAAGKARDDQVLCVLPGGTPDVGAAPSFVADYNRRFGSPLALYGAHAFDAVMLVADAMVRAGSAEPARYLPRLAATQDYAGASGTISFDANGDLQRPALGLFTYRAESLQLVRIVR